MLKVRNKINLIGNALDIVFNNGEYLLVDHNYRVYKFSLKEFMFSFSKQVAKNIPPHHRYSKAIGCSADGYIIAPKNKSSIGRIYKLENNHIFLATRLRWHQADISVSKFSEDSKYLATGGEDGRVFIYTHPNHRLNTFLPRKPDYISSIVFSKSSEKICYASYDLTLTIYDLKTDSQMFVIKTPSVVEDMTFFNRDQKIFYVCKNGEAGIFDIVLNKNEFASRFSSWPTKMMLNIDENYAYIGTRDDILYIHHLKDNTVFSSIKLSSKGVTCIKGYENWIFICFANGNIQIIDRFYKMDEFLTLLNQNEFKQAKVFAEKHNILLKTLQVYTKIKNLSWQKILKDVMQLLNKGETQKILNITDPYFEDPQKEEEIKQYILEQPFIQQFLHEFENGNYGAACEIASKHPCVKDFKEYKKIEEYFENVCDISKYLVFQDPLIAKEKIQKLLEPFKNISEKKIDVMTILNNWDKYFLAEKYSKEEDFQNYFMLAQQCPFLKKSKTYQKMYLKCENLTYKVQNFISSKDYAKAQEYLDFLLGAEPFKEFVIKNQNFLNNIELFYEKCKAKNYAECYKMLELYPEMGASEEAIKLYEEIFNIFEEAKNTAQKGDTVQTYTKIQKFFSVSSWRNKVNITMKIAYLYEMHEALGKKDLQIDWEKSISQYVLRYGKDDEIRDFCNLEETFQYFLDNIAETSKKRPNENINHIQSIIFIKNTEG